MREERENSDLRPYLRKGKIVTLYIKMVKLQKNNTCVKFNLATKISGVVVIFSYPSVVFIK